MKNNMQTGHSISGNAVRSSAFLAPTPKGKSTMKSTMKIKADLYRILSSWNSEERLAWIKKHGAVAKPKDVEVVVSADADAWLGVGGSILPDGAAYLPNDGLTSYQGVSSPNSIGEIIRAVIHNDVRSTGKLPLEIEITQQLVARGAEMAETAQRKARETEDRQAREAALKAAAEKAKADYAAERAAWIAAHGSARLKRCVAESLECEAIYRDERLAIDRPGWKWGNDVEGHDAEPRNPPESAFSLLDEARKTAPDATLVYVTQDEETDDDGDVVKPGRRFYAANADFLGRTICYGYPA